MSKLSNTDFTKDMIAVMRISRKRAHLLDGSKLKDINLFFDPHETHFNPWKFFYTDSKEAFAAYLKDDPMLIDDLVHDLKANRFTKQSTLTGGLIYVVKDTLDSETLLHVLNQELFDQYFTARLL